MHHGFDVGQRAETLDCGRIVERMGVGTQDGEAEAVMTLGDRGSGVVGAQFCVRWDKPIAIDDDISAGNDGGDGALLREDREGKTQAEENCRSSPKVLAERRAGAARMRPDQGNDGITSRLRSASA